MPVGLTVLDIETNEISSLSTGDVTILDPLKVDSILPNTGTVVDVNGVEISALGSLNTLIGKDTNLLITTGTGNVAVGYQSMYSNIESSGNTAIGVQSLYSISDPAGNNNVAVGIGALQFNVLGNDNVAIGSGSLQQLGAGGAVAGVNTSIGANSAPLFGTGSSNVFVGDNCAGAFTSGQQNTFIGSIAGSITGNPTFQTSGNNNIHIGYNTRPASNTASNAITLGNASNNVLRCAVTTITSLSDARDKKDIQELPVGLEFIKKLKPVKFVWNDREEEGKHDVEDFGFIAQDLKATQEESEASYLNLVYDENPEKLEASYGKLLPILVKAIQDLSAKVEALEAK